MDFLAACYAVSTTALWVLSPTVVNDRANVMIVSVCKGQIEHLLSFSKSLSSGNLINHGSLL